MHRLKETEKKNKKKCKVFRNPKKLGAEVFQKGATKG